jgi:hypothetical protein
LETFTIQLLAAAGSSAGPVRVTIVTAAGVDEAETLAVEALGRTEGAAAFRILDEHDRMVAQAGDGDPVLRELRKD